MPTTPPNILSPQLRTKAAAAHSSYYDNSDLNSVWLQAYLHYEKQKNDDAAQRDLAKFIDLAGSLVHPHAQKHLQQVAKHSKAKTQTLKNNHVREMQKKLLGNKQQLKHQAVRKSVGGPLPYVEANSKISRVLKHMKLKTNKEDMQVLRLNEFYKLVARETAAAIVLQSACRRVLATAYARQLALETAQATKIQCFARQFIARRLLQELQKAKQKAALIRERFCVPTLQQGAADGNKSTMQQ